MSKRTLSRPADAGGKTGLCQWLEGDARARRFCGQPVDRIGCSWCARHAAVVFDRNNKRVEAPSEWVGEP